MYHFYTLASNCWTWWYNQVISPPVLVGALVWTHNWTLKKHPTRDLTLNNLTIPYNFWFVQKIQFLLGKDSLINLQDGMRFISSVSNICTVCVCVCVAMDGLWVILPSWYYTLWLVDEVSSRLNGRIGVNFRVKSTSDNLFLCSLLRPVLSHVHAFSKGLHHQPCKQKSTRLLRKRAKCRRH